MNREQVQESDGRESIEMVTGERVYAIDVCPECGDRVLETGSMCNRLHEVRSIVIEVVAVAEVARLRQALFEIAERCGDDSEPEDNPVQMARAALEAPDER